MERIIKSILDTDIYKILMQYAVLDKYPDAYATCKFVNRGDHRFTPEFIKELNAQIEYMGDLRLSNEEALFLSTKCPELKEQYLIFLKNFSFSPRDVSIALTSDNNLDITISGKWVNIILWEVPLMAIISELYSIMYYDKNRDLSFPDTKFNGGIILNDIMQRTQKNASKLNEIVGTYSDFGTRRRYSSFTHKLIVSTLAAYSPRTFKGTSNVKLSQMLDMKPIGTVAHEWYQAHQAFYGYEASNIEAIKAWKKVYPTTNLISLTDTLTTDFFFKTFNKETADEYLGLRQDSGDPICYLDKAIKKYREIGISPSTKKIIFSDSLNLEKIGVIERAAYDLRQSGDCPEIGYGIGTYFTNNIIGWTPLNMVIKLWSINGVPVVKIGDGEGKHCGDNEIITNIKKIININ